MVFSSDGAFRGLEVSGSQVHYQGRIVKLVTCPIGIEPTEFHTILRQPRVQNRIDVLLERYRDVKLMISVDRLDYVKGIPLRMDAMEALLTKHPELVGSVVLLQIIVPSREGVEGYQHLYSQINESVSRINGKFGSYAFHVI